MVTMCVVDTPRFYAALDGMRQSLGLSWHQVSIQTGVSTATLWRLRSGRGLPNADTFATLAWWAGCEIDDVVVTRAL